MAVHLAVACDDGVFLCCLVYREMLWMGSLTKLSQFLRVFLPIFGLVSEKCDKTGKGGLLKTGI